MAWRKVNNKKEWTVVLKGKTTGAHIRYHINQRLPDVGNLMSSKHTNWERANIHLGDFDIREELWKKTKRNVEFKTRKTCNTDRKSTNSQLLNK